MYSVVCENDMYISFVGCDNIVHMCACVHVCMCACKMFCVVVCVCYGFLLCGVNVCGVFSDVCSVCVQ